MATSPVEVTARRGTTDTVLLVTSVSLLLVQVVHVAEHLAQLTAWAVQPDTSAPLTSIAVAGRDALTPLASGDPVGGTELLHLVGNVLFLLGLAALWAYLARVGRPRDRLLRGAVCIQAAHVVEHVALTATWYVGDRATGLTTALGQLEDTAAVGTRVVAHAVLNLVPAALTVAALHRLRGRSTT